MCHIGPGLSSQCAQKSDRPLPRGQRKARDPADLGLWKRYSDRSALAELRSATSGFEAVLREFLSCFSLIFRAFPAFCFAVIRCADHKKRPFSFSNSLMKRTIYYPKQFLWFIILHFCIDVHSCFAVFVSGKVLDGLWINTSIEKIGNVSVPQLMRGYIKVQRISDFGLIFLGHAQRWGNRVFDALYTMPASPIDKVYPRPEIHNPIAACL